MTISQHRLLTTDIRAGQTTPSPRLDTSQNNSTSYFSALMAVFQS